MAAHAAPERTRDRRVARRRVRRGVSAGSGDCPGPVSLEDVVLAAQRELAEAGEGPCPVCRERSLAAGGCRRCGSQLS